jgi:hypothetical protein
MVAVFLGGATGLLQGGDPAGSGDLAETYVKRVQPLLKKYCLECHSTKAHKGDLDLERFTSLAAIRKDLKPWPHLSERVEVGEMPPRDKAQPTDDERKTILTFVRAMLEAEARARAGDPGRVPLRRLSNAEYDCTIRDLTGVDLAPTREFPADGAAGEGFTNAAEALSDITPALFTRYLSAAKDIAEHAVLLPDGFRFSPSKTRRDWTDEGTAALRAFYAAYASGEVKLAVQSYLLATVRHRDALAAGKCDEIAAKEKLNAKYLGVLWQSLSDKKPSQPLDAIRAKWRTATEKDVAALAGEVAAWQAALWKTVKVGNYVRESWGAPAANGYSESLTRQVPVDPTAVQSVPLRLAIKPAPGQSDVVLFLSARETPPAGAVVWHRPRFEAPGKPPLLLRDYADYGPPLERDYPSAFAGAAKYLAAVADAANDPKATLDELAKRNGLDAAYLKQWAKVLAVEPRKKGGGPARSVVPLTLLDEKTPPNKQYAAILGWKKKGADLPVVVANSSDKTLQIPGRVSGHTVGVHPTPQEFVAVAWKSPVEGTVRVAARVAHAHPACGNGVAWWLEHRHADRAALLGEGTLDLGQEAKPPEKSIKVEKGDLLVLAVDPRDADHSCDMTEIWLTITEDGKPNRVWDLARDISADVQAGNPHADKHGNADTWTFVRGPAKKPGGPAALVPANSVLARWRTAIADPDRQAEAEKLARQVETVLTGPRPANAKDPDRVLYDRLVASDSPLFAGVDLTKVAKPLKGPPFGLPRERFAKPGGDSLVVASDKVLEIRLPAALFAGRQFVVDARLEGPAGDRFVGVRAAVAAPDANAPWEGPLLGAGDGPAYKQLIAGHAEFRRVFPLFVCFPPVVPTDEVVTLKMFHREDEPLVRLFLSDEQARKLDRMWDEQRFISRQPVAEYDYLPQFMGYTTQDTPKEFQQFFIDRKPLFKKQAEEFLKAEEAAIPKQLDALRAFAEKAYRRPLQEKEKTDLQELYQKLRKKGLPHDEAFRGVLTRVLTSPLFLFRVEKAPPGTKAGPIDDWEQATRLSYFLWSSTPDDELRQLAAAGKLRDLKVLQEQTRRMLKDPRLRSLAIEFGTQWIHVRNFDTLKEKNEKLFPAFTPALRQAIYEESILFFQDLFQSDRPVTNLLDADYTFLNDTLAKHYGIPGVVGTKWRRVEGVRKFGRGGILGLASVHARQSGASRTSPVLRGNWVVETLLGEKLPRPPADVPILPDQEGTDKLTTRQMVEKHVSNPSCAACHVRIDPYGFAFENFDAIGRWRVKESSGKAVDTRAKLKDGTEFEGIEGLRNYLLTKKKDVLVRLFCQKLLGYALGRATTLSDATLIDEMVAELNKNGGRLSAAVLTIVRSPQFRMIRGRDVPVDD